MKKVLKVTGRFVLKCISDFTSGVFTAGGICAVLYAFLWFIKHYSSY